MPDVVGFGQVEVRVQLESRLPMRQRSGVMAELFKHSPETVVCTRQFLPAARLDGDRQGQPVGTGRGPGALSGHGDSNGSMRSHNASFTIHGLLTCRRTRLPAPQIDVQRRFTRSCWRH